MKSAMEKSAMEAKKNIHAVVLGAGFGGLTFCKQFQMPGARITLVDRTNHHLFQPLLYQVATCGLSAPDIAQPVRSIVSNRDDITVLLDNVTGFEFRNKRVLLEKNSLNYDYLVLALGGQTGYFGHPEWERFAPGLKSLEDALRIRSHVLLAFEQAENEADTAEHDKLMTIVVVGGGPTGVELAGSFAELTRTVLKRDFRRIDPTQARIILIEASPSLLSNFPQDLSASARRQLEALGVQVRTETSVKDIRDGRGRTGQRRNHPCREHCLGGGRFRDAADEETRRGIGSCRPCESESGFEPARSSGNFRHRRHGRRAASRWQTRAQRFSGGDADGQTRRKHYRAGGEVGREPRHPPGIQILGQGHDGDHRALGGGGLDWQIKILRAARVAGLAVCASDFPDRFPQPHLRVFSTGFILIFPTTAAPG